MEVAIRGHSSDSASAWSPLRQPVFRALFIASVASNVGTWMHEVADAWLMTTLTPSPLLVALLQSAEALPIFMLALPSGALADVVDRRRLLLGTQTWMLAVAAALGVITVMGAMTPTLLTVPSGIKRREWNLVLRKTCLLRGSKPNPFAILHKENERKSSHVHNCAHKIWSQFVTDCRRLAQMLGSKSRSSRQFGAYEFLHSTG